MSDLPNVSSSRIPTAMSSSIQASRQSEGSGPSPQSNAPSGAVACLLSIASGRRVTTPRTPNQRGTPSATRTARELNRQEALEALSLPAAPSPARSRLDAFLDSLEGRGRSAFVATVSPFLENLDEQRRLLVVTKLMDISPELRHSVADRLQMLATTPEEFAAALSELGRLGQADPRPQLDQLETLCGVLPQKGLSGLVKSLFRDVPKPQDVVNRITKKLSYLVPGGDMRHVVEAAATFDHDKFKVFCEMADRLSAAGVPSPHIAAASGQLRLLVLRTKEGPEIVDAVVAQSGWETSELDDILRETAETLKQPPPSQRAPARNLAATAAAVRATLPGGHTSEDRIALINAFSDYSARADFPEIAACTAALVHHDSSAPDFAPLVHWIATLDPKERALLPRVAVEDVNPTSDGTTEAVKTVLKTHAVEAEPSLSADKAAQYWRGKVSQWIAEGNIPSPWSNMPLRLLLPFAGSTQAQLVDCKSSAGLRAETFDREDAGHRMANALQLTSNIHGWKFLSESTSFSFSQAEDYMLGKERPPKVPDLTDSEKPLHAAWEAADFRRSALEPLQKRAEELGLRPVFLLNASSGPTTVAALDLDQRLPPGSVVTMKQPSSEAKFGPMHAWRPHAMPLEMMERLRSEPTLIVVVDSNTMAMLGGRQNPSDVPAPRSFDGFVDLVGYMNGEQVGDEHDPQADRLAQHMAARMRHIAADGEAAPAFGLHYGSSTGLPMRTVGHGTHAPFDVKDIRGPAFVLFQANSAPTVVAAAGDSIAKEIKASGKPYSPAPYDDKSAQIPLLKVAETGALDLKPAMYDAVKAVLERHGEA